MNIKENKVISEILLCLWLIILCNLICICPATGTEPCLGDSGKCGRDCIYYICHRLGQQVTLDEIDEQLASQEDVTFSDIRRTFENRGLFCKSYFFNSHNIRSLQTNLNKTEKSLYAIAALSSSSETGHHFVVITKCLGTQITFFDVSNNKSGTIDIANFKGKQITIPVLLVDKQSVHFQVLSLWGVLELLSGIFLFVIIIVCWYRFFPFVLLKRMYFNGIRNSKQIFSSIFSYSRLPVLAGIFAIILLLGFMYREYYFNKYPLELVEQHVDLGEIELSTKNDIFIEIKNRSFLDIPIENIQVSCPCLKVEDFPKIVKAKSNEKIRISLVPLLEENVSYQTLIVSPNNSPILGKISYNGYQRVKALPKYYNIGIVEQGKQEEFICEFSLNDFRGQSFTITSIQMQGKVPIFEVRENNLIQLKNGETFSIVVKHLGNAPPGNFLQTLEIKGKEMNNEDEIILLTNIVGHIFPQNNNRSSFK